MNNTVELNKIDNTLAELREELKNAKFSSEKESIKKSIAMWEDVRKRIEKW